jgi:hypothetical protein
MPTGSTLDALRGYARSAHTTELAIFGIISVVTVQVGGDKVLDHMYFDEHLFFSFT